VNDARWVNMNQPQTLSTATILCYIQGVLLVLGFAFFSFLGLLLTVGLIAGGFGIANEKKWGYAGAVSAAILNVLVILYFGSGNIASLAVLIPLLFAGALVALLLHPMSRDYQRIWFK
jgi:hypothetical protein